MQTRVALRLLGFSPGSISGHLRRSGCRAATTNTTGDPAVHAELPQVTTTTKAEDAESAAAAAAAGEAEQRRRVRRVREGGERESPLQSTGGGGGGGSTRRSSSPLTNPGPKLESSEVPPSAGPAFQQKRSLRSPEHAALRDMSCVGWDGTPLRSGGGEEGGWEVLRQQDRTEEDYKEYFEHHRPTPLSELEFADTRRPIRRATDSDVTDDDAGVGREPPGWREEQQDTVDEALLRAEAMFRAAAERGDPETPHGRVLANYQRLVLF